MSDEIVWVDGDTKNLLVIFRMDPPDSSHYYYFPGEFTFPRVLRWADIEPVRRHVLQTDSVKIPVFLSRIHYWGLVLWINPTLHQKQSEHRPVCIFETNIHTPYLFVKDFDPIQEEEVKGSRQLDWRQKLEWFIAIKYFTSRLPSATINKPETYPSILKEVKLDAIHEKDQKFDIDSILDSVRHLVLVGTNHDIMRVKAALLSGSKEITRSSLAEFLKRTAMPSVVSRHPS